MIAGRALFDKNNGYELSIYNWLPFIKWIFTTDFHRLAWPRHAVALAFTAVDKLDKVDKEGHHSCTPINTWHRVVNQTLNNKRSDRWTFDQIKTLQTFHCSRKKNFVNIYYLLGNNKSFCCNTLLDKHRGQHSQIEVSHTYEYTCMHTHTYT